MFSSQNPFPLGTALLVCGAGGCPWPGDSPPRRRSRKSGFIVQAWLTGLCRGLLGLVHTNNYALARVQEGPREPVLITATKGVLGDSSTSLATDGYGFNNVGGGVWLCLALLALVRSRAEVLREGARAGTCRAASLWSLSQDRVGL